MAPTVTALFPFPTAPWRGRWLLTGLLIAGLLLSGAA